MNRYMFKMDYKTKKPTILDVIDTTTGEVLQPMFTNLFGTLDYLDSGVFPIEPMTAKEFLNDNELTKMLNSTDYIAEEKLDGTRALLYCNNKWGRIFSRRISKKTDYYAENTNNLPHLRDFEYPNKGMTVLDGELFIPHKGFKEVSSVMNCNWEEAVSRQMELGLVHLNAFDILYYKGMYVGNFPLIERKKYLKRYLDEIKCPYIDEVYWFDDKIEIDIQPILVEALDETDSFKEKYPTLYSELKPMLDSKDWAVDDMALYVQVSKKAFYEYVVATGGEGIMLKPKEGKYYQKRGREYTKYKKFLTRDVVVLDYVEPTRDYTGKDATNPDAKWEYWYDAEDDSRIVIQEMTMSEAEDEGLLPCTKYYALDQIGTIKFGVKVTPIELKAWEKANKTKAQTYKPNCSDDIYLVVGECGGINDELREKLTKEKPTYVVMEVLCNEVFTKTGKLRHPRFLRFRDDKDIEQCIWKDHVNA